MVAPQARSRPLPSAPEPPRPGSLLGTPKPAGPRGAHPCLHGASCFKAVSEPRTWTLRRDPLFSESNKTSPKSTGEESEAWAQRPAVLSVSTGVPADPHEPRGGPGSCLPPLRVVRVAAPLSLGPEDRAGLAGWARDPTCWDVGPALPPLLPPLPPAAPTEVLRGYRRRPGLSPGARLLLGGRGPSPLTPVRA